MKKQKKTYSSHLSKKNAYNIYYYLDLYGTILNNNLSMEKEKQIIKAKSKQEIES